jgi:hypothetical protein
MTTFDPMRALDNKWITGWKAIAQHFGISVSSAKRREMKLSVRRLPTGRPIVLSLEMNRKGKD